MGVWKKTQCNMCAAACGLEMEVEDNRIIAVRPDKSNPRSKGYCCRKGRTAKHYQENPDRLDHPLKKVNGEFVQISWEQAYSEIGERAKKILDTHGPRAFCLIGGALPAGQADLVFGRTTMAAIGSQYFFNPIGVEFESSWWSHGKILGDQMHFLEPDDHSNEMIIFWGSNAFVANSMTINAREVIREISQDTERLIVSVDPRLSETAKMADIHIMPKAGSDPILIRGMIALIIQNGWQDKEFIAKYARDYDKILPWFENVDVRACFETAGVSYETMESFCRLLTTKKWGMHPDLGVFMGRHNTVSCYLLVLLEVLCGVALVPGGCVAQASYITRGDNSDENDPNTWRTVKTNRFPVLGTYPVGVVPDEILNDDPRRLRMAFIDSSNCVRSYPDSKLMEKAISSLELSVCIDICMTETAKCCQYVLPAKNGYETYELNAFQFRFPEIIACLRHPVVDQTIGERTEGGMIWLNIAKAMGLMPELPEWLYSAAKRAAESGDRMPYFIKLLAYAATHKKDFPLLPLIVAETLGKYMGSTVRAVLWAAMMTSPIANMGMIEKAELPKLGFHPLLEKMPYFAELCRLDAAFDAVDKRPEGAIIGYSDPDKLLERYIQHKDHKFHLYCDEIDEALKDITPEKEAAELRGSEEYPFVLCAGRHSDEGVNWIMRSPKMLEHRDLFKLQMNPHDAMELGIENGGRARLRTSIKEAEVEVEYSFMTARGFFILPHHFGFTSQGVTYGMSCNEFVPHDHIDRITGDPIYRYVPCGIEKVSKGA